MRKTTTIAGPRIPGLFQREQASGTRYFYLRIAGQGSIDEIPLGSNLEVALARRELILFQVHATQRVVSPDLRDILGLYTLIQLPTRCGPTAAWDGEAARKVAKFLDENRAIHETDLHLQQAYAKWRGLKFQLSTRRELGLVQVANRWYQKLSERFSKTGC